MDSINKVWKDFDKEKGMIDLDNFNTVMLNIAKDRRIYTSSNNFNTTQLKKFFR